MDQLRGALALVVALGILLTVAGHFGHVHPAFDTLAALRVQTVVAFAAIFVIATAFAARTARLLALVGAMIGAAGILPSWPQGPAPVHPEFTLYVHNMRFDNGDLEALEAAIRASGADAVALQEVSSANAEVMRRLEDLYPTQVLCPFQAIGGVAVLARAPSWERPGCLRGLGLAWLTLRLRGGRAVTVASVHLAWPWPHRQAVQVSRLSEALAELPRPVVLAGDFNMAPWGASVARLAEAAETEVAGGLRLTLLKPELWPGLPIDHVLVPRGARVEVAEGPRSGSDHSALIARIAGF